MKESHLPPKTSATVETNVVKLVMKENEEKYFSKKQRKIKRGWGSVAKHLPAMHGTPGSPRVAKIKIETSRKVPKGMLGGKHSLCLCIFKLAVPGFIDKNYYFKSKSDY